MRKPVMYLVFKYGIWLTNAIFLKIINHFCKSEKGTVVFLVFPLKFMLNLSHFLHLALDKGLEWNFYEIIFNKVV